ncbi:adenylate/guanylate cyclase domain-containing protein [Kribbella turkmenica]|uniref:Adenylate/guanylate cyclase domain-containing protein n=1 Tax=Kribbella turkmenica TaxID=2530375 RepID=A0A4R4WW69_9ACTN|nr:adenylate/guanylate cyclase domain-containing protein [Kribbella turkmenica]TDD21950.1 adenylate/guanylate cyclase domain-containing protein [Kribbella turkmenica]
MAERRFVYTPAMIGLTAVVLLIPLAGLLLLLQRPELDVHWEHHPSHFWLVLLTAVLSAVLAYVTGAAALRRGDPRVLLVSLAFLSAAGFLGLHALATPKVLLDTPNAGFTLATPVGVALASVFAVLSSLNFSGERTVSAVRWGRLLRAALLMLMALWAAASVLRLPPLHGTAVPEVADGILTGLAIPAIGLYAVAAGRYLRTWWQRPSLMLLSMIAAFVLLAEAMVSLVFARNWALSWWEWHVLMLAAFVLVVAGVRIQWYEERFADLYVEDTVSGRRELSVLFADLQGFTTFSERHDPAEVTAMLNTYFQVVVPPVVRRHGGDVDRIIGDALMVTFNKRGDQPDHAERAAAAGLALQEAAAAVQLAHPEWPRFRVGINSGIASVSLLGTEGGRTHTVIGDTVNVASRIEGKAPGGGVAIGPATKALLPEAVTESLGLLELKGKAEPLEVYRLLALPGE